MKNAEDDFWSRLSDWESPSAVDLAPGLPRAVLLSFKDYATFLNTCNDPLWRLLKYTTDKMLSAGLMDREELLAVLAACKREQDELMTLEGVMECVSKWRQDRESNDKQPQAPAWTPEVIAGDGAADETREDGPAKGGTRKRPALRSVTDKSNRGKKGDQA